MKLHSRVGVSLRRVLFLGAMTLLTCSCSGGAPVQPTSPSGASQAGTDQRVGDVGGGGSSCLPHPGDPGCAQAHVTILTPDGSSLSLTCEVFLSSPLSVHPIGFSDCGGPKGTGRFEGIRVFDTVALGNRHLLMFQISDSSTVRVELGLLWPTGSKFISEGTLAATVGTLITGTTCEPDQPILGVDFKGVLPRIGAVSGSISATCPAVTPASE